MSGWKTWASGGALILTGLGMIVNEIVAGTWNVREGIETIAGGLAIIGIGHKIEKAKTR